MKVQRVYSVCAVVIKRRAALTAAFFAAATTNAHAFTVPAAGDLGFDLYDIVVNQGVLGPVGFMAAVMMLVVGASTLVRGSYIPGIMSLVAATALFTANQIVTTLGFVV